MTPDPNADSESGATPPQASSTTPSTTTRTDWDAPPGFIVYRRPFSQTWTWEFVHFDGTRIARGGTYGSEQDARGAVQVLTHAGTPTPPDTHPPEGRGRRLRRGARDTFDRTRAWWRARGGD